MEKGLEGVFKKEKEVSRFIYRDNFADHKVIFECEAGNILEADELYEKATGNDPRKQNHVGCSIEKLER